MKSLSIRMKFILGVTLALLPATIVYASEVVLPFKFAAGTPIKSSDVNANFAALRDATNARLESKYGRLAYATFGNCTASPCLVSSKFNSTGGAVSATRTSVGNYTVIFGGLAAGLATTYQLGSVVVSDYGDTFTSCKLQSWSVTGTDDVRALVMCSKDDRVIGGSYRSYDANFTVQAMF
ncbi:MAG: hypothetical protein HYV09_13025 [Deltaproteobacteria bacterium]|nr:hypothetical protein [Deltaproteobacteria bacterium]